MLARNRVLCIGIALCLILMSFSSMGTVFIEQTNDEIDDEDSLHDLSDYTIAVDPGHGGDDPGAVGPSGYTEAECALDIGLRLRDLLEAGGAEVVMTRTTDVTVSLSERVNIANNAGADIFVSIHNNAFDGTAQGIETFYYEGLPPDSDAAELSHNLQDELIDEIDSPDRGVKTANFYVLRETWMPASLTENMFIDNPEEEAKLMDPSVRQRIADAHYRAICEYFDVDPDPPGEAEFVLSGWSASPSTVEPGETVTIQGEVENIGDDEDSAPIELYIDGDYTDTEWVDLGPGQSTTVNFYRSEDEEGTYDIWVFEFYDGIGDDWEGQFTVEQESGAPAPPENLAVEHYSGDNPDASIQGELMGEYEWGEYGECECDYQCQWQFTETENISPDPVEVGETVTISGEVQHYNGDTFQQAAISLWIDGTEVDTYITDALGWHETESFDFERTKGTPGTYDVDLYLFWYVDGSTQGGWHHRWISSFEVADTGEPEFDLSGWSVSPSTVEPNEDVTIEGYVENTGDTTEDDIFARYFIDGSLVDAVPVGDGFAPGDDAFISRDFSREDPGTYDVEIVAYCDATATDHDTWESEFEVVEEGEPQFDLSDWSISPSTVEPGETVTIQGDITNVGDETGDVSAEFYVGGDYEASNWGTLASGDTEIFTHTHSETEEGHYHVEIFAWCDEKEVIDDQWDGDFEVVQELTMEVDTIGASEITHNSATLEGDLVDIGGLDTPHNRLTWDASPDDAGGGVDHYNIYRAEDEEGPWDQLIDSVNADGSNSYEYIDEDAAGEPYHWYVVRAVSNDDLEEGNTDSVREPTMDTEAHVFFRYRESDTSTWEETEKQQMTSEGPFEQTVFNLEPNTEYEFEAVVEWDDEEDTGDTLIFMTEEDTEEPAPPEDLEVEHHGTYDGSSSSSEEQIMVSEPELVYTLFESDFQWASASRPDSPFWEYREEASRVSGYSDLVGPVQGITIHHSAGTYGWAEDPADGVNQVHQGNDWPGAAYDFIIGQDGTIYHGGPLDSLGWHAGDYRNIDNIAICFEGEFNSYEPYEIQYEAGGHLIAYLESLNSITDDRSGSIDLDIDGFDDVTPHDHWGQTGCPGLYFDRDTLEYYYEQYSNGDEPQFVLDDWSLQPNTVNPGETVTVDGYVENVGSGGGYVSVDIYVDDDFEESTPSNPYLEPGDSEWISFEVSRDDSGTYEVDAHAFEMVGGEPVFPAHDSWNGEFEVVDDDDLPEFTLNSWSVSPETANPEETVTIEGEIENVGSVEDVVYGQLWIDDEWQDSEYAGSLAPGETSSVTFQHSEGSIGTYDVEIRAVCEDSAVVYDTWESAFEVVEGTDFDLKDWDLEPSNVDPGETVTISGEVENVGEIEETVYIQLLIDGGWEDTETVYMLDPGAMDEVTFTHSEENVGSYSVEVRAVCEDEINIYSMWSSEFEVVGDVEVETIEATDVTTDSAILHGDLVDIGDEGTEHNLLTWTASPDDAEGEVSHYNIYRSENQDGPWDEPIDSVDADGSAEYSYVDPYAGLADDTFWWYVVRAVGNNEVEEGNTDAVQEPEEDADVHVLFRYREMGDSGWTETVPQPMIAEGEFTEDVSGLESGTEYEFKGVAQWDGQEGIGQIESFETSIEEYTLEVDVEGQGTTDPEPGTYMYDEGTEVTVEATPYEGWEFDHWEVDGENDFLNIEDTGHISYGFWPYWTDPADYQPDWDELTHVSVFSLTAQSDGSLYEGNIDHYDDVKASAQGTDTKVTLTVAQFDQDVQDEILAYHKQELADNIVDALDEYGADGVNIDIEFVRETNSLTGESNVDLMEELLDIIYEDVKDQDEDHHISFCAAGSVEEVYRNQQLSEYADHVFLMGYDYHWGGASNTGPVSPYDSNDHFDVTDSMDILRDYYPDEQLVLGLPFYGYEWPAESDEPGAETQGDGESVFMVDALDKADENGRNWHEDSSVPWYAYEEDGQWYQGWYDDEESLQIKWEYVRDEGFAGTGFWALGYETEETWDTLGEVFSDSQTTITMDEDKSVTAHFKEIETSLMEIPLTADGEADGWNFVSFNLELEDTYVESILECDEYGISGNYDRLMYYDASADEWLSYVPGREEHFNDLEQWDHTMGVWIRMTADDVLTVEGQEPTETTLTLYEGWNTVSYPSVETTEETLPSEVTKIGYFDAEQNNNIAYVEIDKFEFEPGQGYYLYAEEETTWTVQY